MTNNKQQTSWKAPRKLKKQIPKNTPYCYGKKRCKFWQYVSNNMGYCKFINNYITDSIKECGK
jgi:hypothetical protein